MTSFVSPGTYVIEKDNSNYPVSINPSVVGLVGFATQGPVNDLTLITSQEQLLTTFGDPAETIPGQGLEGALEILEATNTLYFVRAADADQAAEASGSIDIGGCPAVAVSADSYGLDGGTDIYFDVQVSIDGVDVYTTPKQFDVPAGTLGSAANQADALKKIIGGSVDGAKVGVEYDTTEVAGSDASGYIRGGFAGSGVILEISAYSTDARTAAVGLSALVPVLLDGTTDDANYPIGASSLSVTGCTFESTGANGIAYVVESLYPGGGYNLGTKEDGSTSGFSAEITRTGGITNTLQINRNGYTAESFKGSVVAEGAWWESVINTGDDNKTSTFVKANFYEADVAVDLNYLSSIVQPIEDLGITAGTLNAKGQTAGDNFSVANAKGARFIKLIEGTYDLTGGDSGIPAAAQQPATLIGTAADKTGLYALDDDLKNISIAAIPGITDESVQNNLITLAEDSQNFLAVVAPPEGYTTLQEAIDWHNGQSDERTAAITSNFAAIYWPWVQNYDVFAKKDRWYDPSIWAIRVMCTTDDQADPWFAPAGTTRGRLTKPTDVEVNVNQGDRDSMYSGGNVINPIVNFPQQGIVVFGQRTAQRDGSALDRVNVRRLLIVIRKSVLAVTRRFVFEPNDATTWEKVEKVLELYLDEIKRRRGLVEYKVVCDETTNTAIRVDRNEMWAKCILKPTKAAEIVVVELDLRSQSADI